MKFKKYLGTCLVACCLLSLQDTDALKVIGVQAKERQFHVGSGTIKVLITEMQFDEPLHLNLDQDLTLNQDPYNDGDNVSQDLNDVDLVDTIPPYDQPIDTVQPLNGTRKVSAAATGSDSGKDLNVLGLTGKEETSRVPFDTWMAFSRAFEDAELNPLDMKCGNVTHAGSSSSQSEGPGGYYMMPCGADPIKSVFAFFEEVDLKPIRYRPKCLTVIWMHEQVMPSGQVQPMSGIANFTEKLETGQCSIAVKPFFFARDGISLNDRFNGTINTMTNPIPSFCDHSKLLNVLEEFKLELDRGSAATTANAFATIDSRIDVMATSDVFMNCLDLLNAGTVMEDKQFEATSTKCYQKQDSLEWRLDQCCNPQLADRKCCAPRRVAFTKPIVKDVNLPFIAKTCTVDQKNIGGVLRGFRAYAKTRDAIENPTYGCAAIAAYELGADTSRLDNAWERFSGFATECGKEIFGDNFYQFFYGGSSGSDDQGAKGKECKSNADCYTECVKSDGPKSYCVIPWKDQLKYLSKCYVEKMSVQVARNLNRLINVPQDKPAQFEEKLNEAVNHVTCTGPTSLVAAGGYWRVNEYYCQQENLSDDECEDLRPIRLATSSEENPVYEESLYQELVNSYKFYFYSNVLHDYMAGEELDMVFYVPANKERCLAETTCNSYLKDGEACTTDSLDNGGMFCGETFDGTVYENLSSRGVCTKTRDIVSFNEVRTLFSAAESVYYDQLQQYTQNLTDEKPDYPVYEEFECSLNNGTYVVNGQYSSCEMPGIAEASKCLDSCLSAQGPQPRIPQSGCYKKAAWWDPCTLGGQYGMFCVSATADRETCLFGEHSGYTFGPLPVDVQSALTNLQCAQSMCLNNQVKFEKECTTGTGLSVFRLNGTAPDYTLQWMSNLANGAGKCVVNFDSNDNLEDQCRENGDFDFYAGRTKITGAFDTPEKCTSQSCDADSSLSASDCASSGYCDRPCKKCRAVNSFVPAVCVHYDEPNCNVTLGTWTTFNSTQTCLHATTSSIEKCQTVKQDHKMVPIKNFSRDLCRSDPLANVTMRVEWADAECETREECEAVGQCSDLWQLGNDEERSYYAWDDYDAAQEDKQSLSNNEPPQVICMFQGEVYDSGYRVCEYNSEYFNGGCARRSTSQECTDRGGVEYSLARTREQCLAKTGCCVPGKDCSWSLTQMPPNECAKCQAITKPSFEFFGGHWTTGKMISHQWVKREQKTTNEWKSVPNMEVVRSLIDQAVASSISDVLLEQKKCRYSPVLQFMEAAACECGINEDTSRPCRARERAITLMDRKVDCGSARLLSSSSGVQISFKADSATNCSDTKSTLSVKSSKLLAAKAVPIAQRDFTSVNKRSLYKRSVEDDDPSSCYAYVQNDKKSFVGQLRGDCVVFKTNTFVSNVDICMPINDDIPHNATIFSESRVALLQTDQSTGVESYVATSAYTVLENSQRFCITVSTQGTFCPVSVRSDWQTSEDIAQPECTDNAKNLESIQTVNANLANGAVELRFSAQPSTTVVSGVAFTSLAVKFYDKDGRVVTDAESIVTLSLVASNGASVLGTPRLPAVGGECVFTNVAVDLVGSGYKLVATSGRMASATSDEFAVAFGAASSLKFMTQPAGVVKDEVFLQAPSVGVIDLYGNLITNANVAVRLNVTQKVNTAVQARSFTSGTSQKSATSGTVSFTDLKIGAVGQLYQIVASADGLSSATSDEFGVFLASGFAVKLRFSQQPADSSIGSLVSAQPTVEALDFANQRATGATGSVALKLLDSNDKEVTVRGTSIVTFQSGVAVFSDLMIDAAANGYRFKASSGSMASAVSSTFAVNGAASVEFTEQPTGQVNGSFVAKVKVKDNNGLLFTAKDYRLEISIKPLSGSSQGVLTGVNRVSTVNGEATFNGLTISAAGSDYVLVVSNSENTFSGESAPFSIVTNLGNSEEEDPDSVKDIVNDLAARFNLSPIVISLIAVGAACLALVLVVMVVRYFMSSASGK